MNINDFNNNKLLSISQSSTTSFTNIISSSYLFLNNINYGITYSNNALQITANSNIIHGDLYVNGKMTAKEYASNVVILDKTNKIPITYIPAISSNYIINCNILNGIGTTRPLTKMHLRDGDLFIDQGRLGIGTIPAYYCHINKDDNNTGMPAFVVTGNDKHVIDIYAEKGVVIINDDGSQDRTIINSNIKLQVFGITKTNSLITNDLYINKIYSNSNNRIEINNNTDLILSNISIGTSLSNLSELKTRIDNYLYQTNQKDPNNLIVSNLTLLNYDSLTSNPFKESVFDIKGKIKLYNDTENIVQDIYINDNDFYFITTNRKLYKNLILNTANFNFDLFKSKYEIYGYHNKTTGITGINTDTTFLTSISFTDFALTTSPNVIFYINNNYKIFKYNKTNNTSTAITDATDVNRNYIKIDTYKTPEDTFVVLSSSGVLYFYSGGVFQIIEFPIPISSYTILDFSSGNNHTLVLTTNGIWSFGSNENNITLKKGYITSETSLIKPEKISLLNSYKIIKIKAYGNSSIVLDENGKVFIFGTINSNYQQNSIYEIPNIAKIINITCNNTTIYLLSYFGDIYTLVNLIPTIVKLTDEFYGVSIKSRGSIVIGGNNFIKQPPRNSLLVDNYVAIGSNITTYDGNYSLVVSGNINVINGNIYNNGVLFSGGTGSSISTSSTNNFWEKNNIDIYYPNGNVGIGILNPLTKLHVNGSLTVNNDIYLNGKIISSEYKPIEINEPKNIYYKGKFGINIKNPQTNFHLYDSTFRITDIIPDYKIQSLNTFTCNIINSSLNSSYYNPIKISEDGLTIVSSFYNNEISDNNNNNSNIEIYKYFNNKWNSYNITDIPNGNTSFGESICVSKQGSVIYIGSYKQKIVTNTNVIQTGGIYRYYFNNNQLIRENLETFLINPNTNDYYFIGKNICCSSDGNVIISTIVNDNNKLYTKNISKNTVLLLDYTSYASSFHSSFNNNTTLIDSNDDGSTIVVNFTYNFSGSIPLIANFGYFNIYIIHNYKTYLLKFDTSNSITNSEVISVSVSADGTRIFINTKLGYHFIYDIYELDYYNFKTFNTNVNYIDVKPSFYFYKQNDIGNDEYKGKLSKSGNVFIIFNSKRIFIYKYNLSTNIWKEEEFIKDIHLISSINNYSISLDYYGYNYAISYIKKLQDTNSIDQIQIINNNITTQKERIAIDFNNSNSILNIDVNSYFNSNLIASYFYGDGSNITNLQFPNIITSYSNNFNNGSIVYTSNNHLYYSTNLIWSNASNSFHINNYLYVNSNIYTTLGNIYSGSNIYSKNNIYTTSGSIYSASNIYAASNIIASSNIYANSNLYVYSNLFTNLNIYSIYGNIIAGADLIAYNNIISTSNIYTCNNSILKTSGAIISGTNITATSNIYTCNNGFLRTSGAIISGTDIIATSNIYTCNNGILKTSGMIIGGTDIIATSNIYTCNNGILKTSGMIIGGTDIIATSNIYTCNNGILKTSGMIIGGTDIIATSNIYTSNNGILKTSGTIIGGTDIIATSNIYTCNNGILKTSGTIIGGTNIIATSNIYTCNNGILKTSGTIIGGTDIIATSNIYTCNNGFVKSSGLIIAGTDIISTSNIYTCNNGFVKTSGAVIAGTDIIATSNIYTCNNGFVKTSGDIISGSNIYTCNNGFVRSSGLIIAGTDIIATSNIYTCNNGFIRTSGLIIGGTDIIATSNIYTCNNGFIRTSGLIIAGTDIIATSNIYTCNNCFIKTSGLIIAGTDIISTSNIYTCNNGFIKTSGDIISGSNIYTCNNGFVRSSGLIIAGTDIIATSNIYTCNNGFLITSGPIIAGTDIIVTSNIYTCNNGFIRTSGLIIAGTDIITTSNIYTCNNGFIKTSGSIIAGTDIIATSNIYTCNNGFIKTSGDIICGKDIYATQIIADGSKIRNLNSSLINGVISFEKGGLGFSNISQYNLIYANNTNSLSNTDKLQWNEQLQQFLINGELSSTLIKGNGFNITNINPGNIIGILNVNKGGIGKTSLDTGGVLIGNGTNPVIQTQNFIWDNPNSRLGINTSIPQYTLDVNGIISCSQINIGNINLTPGALSGVLSGLNLNADNISSGILKVNYGGTGLNTLNSNQLLIGNGTNAIIQSSGLIWDNKNARLGINSQYPNYALDVTNDININGSLYQNGKLVISNSNITTSNITCSNIDITGYFNINNGKIIAGNNDCNVILSPIDNSPEKGIYTDKRLFIGFNEFDDRYKLKVNGHVYVYGSVSSLSDSRYKTNISVIENPNEKIKKLRGVYYNLINEQKRSMGLIAQDVEEVLPEVIYTNSDNTTKSIAYGNLIGLIIESIKDILNHLNL